MAIKTYKSSQKDLNLSANFKVREFFCQCRKCTSSKIDDKLVNYVQKIRDHFDQPVTVNSAYRCAAHNKAVGGASSSYHTKGQAADIIVKGVKPAEVAKYAESIGILGIGLYETDKDGHFVHIDTRTTKSFWYGQKNAKRDTFGGAKKPCDPEVKAFQQAAIKDGYKLTFGTNGVWDKECEQIAAKATLYQTKYPWRLKNLTKFVQKYVGVSADGKFGAGTKSAVISYQKKKGLSADGVVGVKTYKAICGVK